MKRTVADVIEDLKKESLFQAKCGLVPTANLLTEAVYYLKKYKKEKEKRE